MRPGDQFGAPSAARKRRTRKVRQHIDILLQRLDVGLAELVLEPVAQCLQRPDVADPGLRLDDGVRLRQHVERLRRVEVLVWRER